MCSLRVPGGVKYGDLLIVALNVWQSHEVATGESLSLGKVGFQVVDPYVPIRALVRLKGGQRVGDSQLCVVAGKSVPG